MIPQPSDALPNYAYFMTLVREDDLQFRIGECVYVLREGDQAAESPDKGDGGGQEEGEKEERESVRRVERESEGCQGKENWDIFQVERLYKNEK